MWMTLLELNLHNYFDYHVCLSIRFPVSVRCPVSQIFFSLKSPWDHPLTFGVDPSPQPPNPRGHAAPREELARAQRALSSHLLKWEYFLMKIPQSLCHTTLYYIFDNPVRSQLMAMHCRAKKSTKNCNRKSIHQIPIMWNKWPIFFIWTHTK